MCLLGLVFTFFETDKNWFRQFYTVLNRWYQLNNTLLNSNFVSGIQKEFRMFESVPLDICSVKMGKNKLNMKVNKINKAFQCLNDFQFELHVLVSRV